MKLIIFVLFAVLASAQSGTAPNVPWVHENGTRHTFLFYVPPSYDLWTPVPDIQYDDNCISYIKHKEEDGEEYDTERVDPSFNANERPRAYARCILVI